jgi:hypothetical protein
VGTTTHAQVKPSSLIRRTRSPAVARCLKRLWLVLFASVIAASAACTARQHADAGLTQVLLVPRAKAPIKPTGQFDLNIWGAAANTHTLLDREGHGAVPVSEARFLWGDGQLYMFFYAADIDLQVRATQHDGPVWKDDSVALTLSSSDGTKRVIQISPGAIVADGVCPEDAIDLGDPRCDLKWESRVHVAADVDGTINDAHDFDEEWAVEAAVPIASLSLGGGPSPVDRVPLRVSRCEIAYDGVRACGSWGVHPKGGLELVENLR